MKKVLFTSVLDSFMFFFNLPLLKYFKENGYEVHVATNGDEKIPYCDVKHQIPFERSPYRLNNIKAIKQLRKIIDKEQFEIIHCHTPMGSVVTRIAAKNARKNGTRVIYTAHGFHFYKGAPILNWCLFYPMEKWLSKYTDTLITINMEDYELAKNKFKKCKDIEYVPGIGIDENKFNFDMTDDEKKELRKSLGIEKDDFVVIYVAELTKRKNQSMAIESIKELVPKYSNLKLLLVGKDSYDGKYQELVKELGIENNVIFTGYRSDVPKLMKISDMAISTARQEGLPVNIMEAFECNLPVVATNCRGNRDLVDKENLVEIGDTEELRKKIEKQITDRNIVNRNYRKNRKKYSLNYVLKEMEKIYTND